MIFRDNFLFRGAWAIPGDEDVSDLDTSTALHRNASEMLVRILVLVVIVVLLIKPSQCCRQSRRTLQDVSQSGCTQLNCTAWTNCSLSCGGGTQSRVCPQNGTYMAYSCIDGLYARACQPLRQTQACNVNVTCPSSSLYFSLKFHSSV